jgi:hypothetical protein
MQLQPSYHAVLQQTPQMCPYACVLIILASAYLAQQPPCLRLICPWGDYLVDNGGKTSATCTYPVSLLVIPPSQVKAVPATHALTVALVVVLVVPTHLPLSQSVGSSHVAPGVQAPHVGPPQSTPVSLPFLMPSLQDAAGGGRARHRGGHKVISRQITLGKSR